MWRPRTDRRLAGLVLVLALIAPAAAAEDEPVRKLGLSRKGDSLLVSFGYTDIFDAESRAKLTSGLPTTVLMRMSLVPHKKKTPLSFTLRNASITYDLWDEVYHVVVKAPGMKTKKVMLDDASVSVKLAAKVKKHPISIEDVPPGTYRLRVRVDRNPVSKEVLNGMRSWLNRPVGSTGRLRPGDGFFGSFISFFINKKLQKAEKTKQFRSQKFTL
ncbi:MAG: hypothetical protein JRG91_04050 [Deltaproteobacteria bacterium]|nr:hypothetical protein [Deltaproteobacteria bacterium]